MSSTVLDAPAKVTAIRLTSHQRKYLRFKRVVDFLTALIALTILMPILLLIALILKLDSPKDPVIFRQKRIGLNGKEFNIYKFRTMKTEAPHEMATSEFLNAEAYITPIGRKLRNTSIDELPQLVNVLKGEMSILGPRPLILAEEKVHSERMKYGVYQVRPGLSGLAQVHGRDALNDHTKVLWDRRYVEEIGPRMDIGIFITTFGAVLNRRGVIDSSKQKHERATMVEKRSDEQ